jgi:biopolymer transport protein ExbD
VLLYVILSAGGSFCCLCHLRPNSIKEEIAAVPMLEYLHALVASMRLSNTHLDHSVSQALPEQQADRQQSQQQQQQVPAVAADDDPQVDPMRLQLEKQLLQKATAGKGFALRYSVPWDIW